MKEKEVWEMTKDEWMSHPREFRLPAREITLDEYRSSIGYPNPLEDHGGLKYPNGISKAEWSRIKKRLSGRIERMKEGEKEYLKLKQDGELPKVLVIKEIRADGLDLESQLAAARVYHKREVMKAIRQGKPVPDKVLKDYRK